MKLFDFSHDSKIWQGNVLGTSSGESNGVIVNKGGNLQIIDSAFLGNKADDPEGRFSHYIVGNLNGTLTMRGNCFVGNEPDYATAISHSDSMPVRVLMEIPNKRLTHNDI